MIIQILHLNLRKPPHRWIISSFLLLFSEVCFFLLSCRVVWVWVLIFSSFPSFRMLLNMSQKKRRTYHILAFSQIFSDLWILSDHFLSISLKTCFDLFCRSIHWSHHLRNILSFRHTGKMHWGIVPLLWIPHHNLLLPVMIQTQLFLWISFWQQQIRLSLWIWCCFF